MTEETPEEARKREANEKRLANLKKFEPGNPGGPGRPKGSLSMQRIFKEVAEMAAPEEYITRLEERGVILSGKTWGDIITIVAFARAAGGSPRHLEIVLDRILGKATQNIDARIIGDVNLVFEKKPRQREALTDETPEEKKDAT